MSTVLSKQFALEQLEGAKLFLNQLNLNEKLWFITKSNVIKATGVSLASLVLIYLGKIWYSYRFFKKRGLKTPKIKFFYGNFHQLNSKNYSEVLRDWTRELGKTYGVFEGHSPVLITSDIDVIQEVFVKQYSNFAARKRSALSERDDDPKQHLLSATNTRWKRQRNIMNPTFSTSKLRELSPLMIKCVDRLNQSLGLRQNNEIHVAEFLKRFTLDTIWNCAFGVDINVQFDKSKDEYYYKCEAIFQNTIKKPLIERMAIFFHEFRYQFFDVLSLTTRIMSKVFGKISHPVFWLFESVFEIVDSRNKEKVPRKDYLQLLLDAQTTEKVQDSGRTAVDLSNVHFEKKLNMDEIKMNLAVFMLAGYETTSTALTYSSFLLAKYPEEQEKLYEEIVSYFPHDSDVEPEIDTVQDLTYLDMFIKEVLRMYPIANSVVARRCTKATNVKGIDIPVDTDIMVDVLSLHNDPELWGPVDPEQFYPARFSPEQKRNPIAFATFGVGPRHCIGMKFALQELKFSFVKLLKKYEVVAGPNMPDKLHIVEGAVRSPKNVSVIFKPRIISN